MDLFHHMKMKKIDLLLVPDASHFLTRVSSNIHENLLYVKCKQILHSTVLGKALFGSDWALTSAPTIT